MAHTFQAKHFKYVLEVPEYLSQATPRVLAVASTMSQNLLPGPICGMVCKGFYNPQLTTEFTFYYKM